MWPGYRSHTNTIGGLKMKIIKKLCKDIIEDIQHIENTSVFNRSILGIYFWVNSSGRIEYFISCSGQGILDVIYNNKVDYKFYSLFDLIDGFTNKKDKIERVWRVLNIDYN